jgi:excisionase family DNA binding protein
MAGDPEILTPKEVCEILRIHRGTLYKMLRKGELPAFRLGGVGGEWRLHRDQLSLWIAEGGGSNKNDRRRGRRPKAGAALSRNISTFRAR